jgi:hypothetical protein
VGATKQLRQNLSPDVPSGPLFVIGSSSSLAVFAVRVQTGRSGLKRLIDRVLIRLVSG